MNEEVNNDTGMDPISLGEMTSVDPIEPVDTIDSLDDTVAVTPTIPDANNSYDIPEPININPMPNLDNIGVVPPIVQDNNMGGEEQKPKKKSNKAIILMIVVLVIAAVGVGVYIMLNMANRKTKPTVTLKEVTIEVNSEVPTLISDYANNATGCSLDVTGITDTSEVGKEYEYIVTCNGISYKGKAKIVDTIKPEVVTRDVTKSVNSEIKAEDFIESCTDSTECKYSFKDEEGLKENLKTVGEYQVQIIVSDTSDNKTEVTAKLVVKDGPIAIIFLDCSKKESNYNLNYRLGFSSDGLVKEATKSYEFTLDEEAYKKLKEDNGNVDTITYKEVSGTPTFDDNKKSLTITVMIDDINKEMKRTLPTSYAEVMQYFTSQGYSCL